MTARHTRRSTRFSRQSSIEPQRNRLSESEDSKSLKTYNDDYNNNIDDDDDNDDDDAQLSEEYEKDIHDYDIKKKKVTINAGITTQNGKINDHKTNQNYHNQDVDEDEGIRSHRTRSHKNINYNEDALSKDFENFENDDIEGDADKKDINIDNIDDEYYNEDNNNNRNISRSSRSHKHVNDDDDDDDFNIDENDDEYNDFKDDDDDDFLDSDDDFTSNRAKRRKINNFIVKDDYDDDDEYGVRSSRSSRQSRNSKSSRSSRLSSRAQRLRSGNTRLNSLNNDNNIDSNDPVTLEDELKDLQNDSPLNSPKRNLRHRKEVNYQLPPPESIDNQFDDYENESTFTSPRKGKGIGRYGGASTSNLTIRRLFPTVGPFGGSEVQSLFQSNSIPSGLAALANAESSDSDDENDLIKPTNPNNGSNIITSSSASLSANNKKNTLADTDPLGIDTNIDFSVIGGLDNYINQLKEMITLPLLYPEVYSRFHITPPRGVLFHGPPGTGKTLMARALASSCSSQNKKITFFMRKGADCLSKWVGEAERHLRLLFEEAKQHQPSIIFFDEIDGLAPVRSSKQEQIHASIVSTLLALMDGMDNRGQVIIIGATNRPDSIDPALRRPGRFDREFYFPLPDLKSREEILKIHMRKWDTKLNDEFIKELAVLTKGYGGADLRALCTESALNSIQREFPQIYKSNDKLKIDISKINVNSSDFTRALKKIVPNSARSTNNIFEPLPESIKPLLNEQLNNILTELKSILPFDKEISLLEESQFENLNNNFKLQQLVKTYDSMRVFKPRLAIMGNKDQGLKYLSNSILNKLEGFTIQILDLGKIYSDSSISIENLCIQLFSELRRHKPSILFIPDTIGFLNTISESLKSTIKYLIRNINNNDKILIYCELEANNINDELLEEIEEIFDINIDDIIKIRDPTNDERRKFFENFWNSITLTPNNYNDLSIRPKKKFQKLEVVEHTPNDDELKKSERDQIKTKKQLAKNDMRLKNSLKVKLSGLLDIFKIRYKRFKKPIIDDSYLVHLFDKVPDPNSNYQIKNDKILEISTNKLYNNIDLEVIEERLWNGYYNEPRQFLNDLELILKDANMSNERDRIVKANEMYAHAVVGIEEIELQFPALIAQWKEVSQREKQRKLEYIKLQKEKEEKEKKEKEAGELLKLQVSTGNVINGDERIENEEENLVLNNNDEAIVIADGLPQEQAQEQLQPGQLNGIEKSNTELEVKPIELSEPVEKVETGKIVEDLIAHETATIVLNTKEKATTNPTPAPDVENSKPSDIEAFLPEVQIVSYDKNKLKVLQDLLLTNTTDYKISKLERINSKLCNIVWNHRLNLDKSELLQELENYITGLI